MKFLHFNFVVFFLAFQITGLMAQDYPLNEEVKIYYDKSWKPVKIKDSASYYRLITFKEKNIPKGVIKDYYINGVLQSKFYANYVGINKQEIDSVVNNGPSYYYNSSGIKNIERNFFNDIKVGIENYFYETGEIKSISNYEDGLIQGEEIGYYESGEVEYALNYVDNFLQGEQNAQA